MSGPRDITEKCPFCKIEAAFPAEDPLHLQPEQRNPAAVAHLILSAPNALAFLDHAPITRGHTLVISRKHREKASDLSIREGQALGAWLPVLARAIMRAAGPPASDTGTARDYGDWNVVQNNGEGLPAPSGSKVQMQRQVNDDVTGAGASQVVPHVHYHIIPRSTNSDHEAWARSWTMFGKGQRQDLDDDDAVVLTQQIRNAVKRELAAVEAREGKAALHALYDDQQGLTEAKL